jgi:hypothetical protein
MGSEVALGGGERLRRSRDSLGNPVDRALVGGK